MNELDDYFWDDLPEFIEAEKVIPNIGLELVTVIMNAGKEWTNG